MHPDAPAENYINLRGDDYLFQVSCTCLLDVAPLIIGHILMLLAWELTRFPSLGQRIDTDVQ